MAENQEMAGEKSAESPKNLDWYIKKRSGKKRDYIYSATKMKVCPHNHLHALAVGGNWYRCEDCNYAFCITQAYVQPLHNVVVAGLLNALHFSKEFGSEALQEVLRTPKGQHEADYHLPALPEGMNFWEAAEALDKIDVNALDGGKAQLQDLFEKTWIPLAERKRRNKELGLPMPEVSGVLMDGNVVKESVNGAGAESNRTGTGLTGEAVSVGDTVPSVSRRRKGTHPKNRDSRKS